MVTGNKENYTERNFTFFVLSITLYGRSIKDWIESTGTREEGKQGIRTIFKAQQLKDKSF